MDLAERTVFIDRTAPGSGIYTWLKEYFHDITLWDPKTQTPSERRVPDGVSYVHMRDLDLSLQQKLVDDKKIRVLIINKRGW